MRRDSDEQEEIEMLPEKTIIPNAWEPVHPEPVRAVRQSDDGSLTSMITRLLSHDGKKLNRIRSLPPFPNRRNITYRRHTDTEASPPEGTQEFVSREVTLSRRRNLIRSTTRTPHWLEDDNNFRAVELQKRAENEQMSALDTMDNSWSHTKLFFSHCWRDVATQERKRLLFSALTDEGAVFWSDFLDLQAQGPIPWRNEISHAIQSCSKVVALVDEQYLLSYNCLEELAYAIHYRKPLVIGIMDQPSWNLLTIVNGQQQAWRAQPASGGLPLSSYSGQGFGPTSEPFSLQVVQRIFSTLAAINFCPCRELDMTNIGAASVAERLVEFVNKDLEYTKEHAFLQLRSEAWDSVRRPDDLLLERRADVDKWTGWLDVSNKAQFFPPPTSLQEAYVAASQWRYDRRSYLAKVAAVILLALILCLAVGATVAAVVATRESFEARSQKQEAIWQQRAAAAMALCSSSVSPGSTEVLPDETVMSRRVLRAAEVADAIGFPALAMPALLSTLGHLAATPYWILDIQSHNEDATGVSLSPNGEFLASASLDGTVRVRRLPSREFQGASVLPGLEEEAVIQCQGPVLAVSWSPSGELLAASCDRRGQQNEQQGSSSNFSSSSPSSSEGEESDAAGGRGPSTVAVVWELRDSGCLGLLHELDLGGEAAKTLSWSPDSKIFATGDHQKRIWYIGAAAAAAASRSDGAAGPPESTALEYKGERKEDVRTLAWGPSGKVLAAGGTDSTMVLWGVGSGASDPAELLSVSKLRGDINSLAFSDEGLLASATDALQVQLWDATTFVPDLDARNSSSGTRPLPLVQTLPPNGASVIALAWSPSGELATASESGVVQLFKWHEEEATEGYPFPWSQQQRKRVLRLHLELTSPVRYITSLSYAPDRVPSLLVAGTKTGLVRGWQAATPLGKRGPESFKMNCTQEMEEQTGEILEVRAAAWSPDGDTFAVGSYRGYVCVWRREEEGEGGGGGPWGEPVVLGWELPGRESRRRASRVVVFDASGTQLAAGDDYGGVHVWRRGDAGDSDGWEHVSTVYGPGEFGDLRGLDFSWDGLWLAGTTENGAVSVWNPLDPTATWMVLEGHEGEVPAVAWKPVEESGGGCMHLATGGDDCSLRIWELCRSDGGLLELRDDTVLERGPLAHAGGVRALAWSADGEELASSGQDGRLLVHSFGGTMMQLRAEIIGRKGEGMLLSWSPGGRQLVSASSDRSVRVWDLDGDQARQNRSYTMWRVNGLSCRYLRWLRPKPYRLACARKTISTNRPDVLYETPPFTYWVEYMMLEYGHQRDLLRSLTYGELTAEDLRSIGYESIASTALDKELIGGGGDSTRNGGHDPGGVAGLCGASSSDDPTADA